MARREPGVSVLSLYFPVSTDQGPPASSSSEETGGPLVCRVREGRIPGVQLLPRQLPTLSYSITSHSPPVSDIPAVTGF